MTIHLNNLGLSLLLFFLVSHSTTSALATQTSEYKYSKVIDQHQKEVLGQEIETYYNRWFWEPVLNTEIYTSFFYFENMKPKIIFLNADETPLHASELRSDSLYNEFLKDNDISLKQPPLKDWNYISTGNDGHHLFEKMYGNFAWDIVKKKNGVSFKNLGYDNQDYFVWSEPVYAPISGTVIEISRDVEDNKPDPTNSNDLSSKGDGNLVLIHVYDRFYFILMHFKKNSIPKNLIPGSKIKAGDYLGEVGNSGVSYTPHLHMTMYYWSSQFNRMISVPTVFKTIEVKSLDGLSVLDFSVPKTGDQIKALH